MKKSLLLILAVFAFTFANAQGFRFGIKAGWNYATISGSDADGIYGDTDYKNSYHFGIMPNFRFGGIFGLRPELLYTSKGFQANYTQHDLAVDGGVGTSRDVEEKTNFNYLSLPLLMTFNAGPIFFELGPEFAYMLAATQELKVTVEDVNGNKDEHKDEKHTEKDDIGVNSFEFGYVAGLGVNLPAGFGLGLRYNGSFMSVLDYEDASGDDINAKNSVFMLSLNYTFGGHGDE